MTTTATEAKADAVTKHAVSASAKAWLDAIAVAKLALSRKAPLPILHCALISVSGEQLTLTTNNYETSIVAHVDGSTTSGDFEALIPLSFLETTIKTTANKLRDSRVTIEVMSFLDQELTIVACEGFRIPSPVIAPVDEYPRFTHPTGPSTFDIPADVLKQTIKRTAVASSKDRTLPILTALHFTADKAGQRMLVESTDRYRLAQSNESAAVHDDASFLLDGELMIKLLPKIKQKRAVSVVVSKDGDDKFHAGVSVKLIFENFSISIVSIAGDYPKLAALFSHKYEHNFVASRAELVRSATVALNLSQRNTPVTFELLGTRLHLKPNLESFDKIAQGMIAVPDVAIEPSTKDRIDFAVNPVYLLDALKTIDEESVMISFNETHKPFIFSGATQGWESTSNFRYLLMPVRFPS
ncbi:DNA polymerase III sliding clamp beta [Arthrobacter phage EastWest]|uniref:DNA polymerase III sliding clamp beta n=1 Tax=Arthrobacter phage EastWest TaxID=2894292 RepID=A0AAE8YP50_9CAUD|nr:DNA polymerase III sliding clamp beta [Arthrobacter phage EastWest]